MTGSRALRITSWITYGLFMADAVYLLALGVGDQEVEMGPIIAAVALGGTSLLTMTIDTAMSAGQASRAGARRASAAQGMTITPYLAPLVHTTSGEFAGSVRIPGAFGGLAGHF